jgi:hypothetical protein
MLAVVLALALGTAEGHGAEAPVADAPVADAHDAEPAPPSPLDDAEKARAAGDAAACGKAAQDALATGVLDVEQTARAWALRGRCFVIAGDLDRGERSYAVALRLQPGMEPLAVDDKAFTLAKETLPPAGKALLVRAQRVDADVVEVELVVDDLLLVKSAALVRGADEVARVPLEAGKARHKVGGIDPVGLDVVALDKHGNQLVRAPVDTSVEKVLTPPPATASSTGAAPTVLTTLGATAIGAGIVGIVASGIGVASLGPDPGDDATLWYVGVGASTALFLAGAGLVVVDQGFAPGALDAPPHASPAAAAPAAAPGR